MSSDDIFRLTHLNCNTSNMCGSTLSALQNAPLLAHIVCNQTEAKMSHPNMLSIGIEKKDHLLFTTQYKFIGGHGNLAKASTNFDMHGDYYFSWSLCYCMSEWLCTPIHMFDCMAVWLCNWVICECVTAWLCVCVTVWLFNHMIVWLTLLPSCKL